MNKIIMYLWIISAIVVTGCKSLPTVESVSTLGDKFGKTTAYILNKQDKVDDDMRTTIIRIINEVERFIPKTNETFTTTWTPIVNNFLNDFKDKSGNHLSEYMKDRVLTYFTYIVTLIDKYIEKKGIGERQELVDAFVHSFCSSFLADFKPANVVSVSTCETEIDQEIYNDLIKLMN